MSSYEDPFLCPPPIGARQWRMQLRSSSHDIPMPDYISNKTDQSRAYTEMSGLSFPRANFLKHMTEANPEEIVQALSPVKQGELLKVLSASQSPLQGANPPSNTPYSLSAQGHTQSTGGQVPNATEIRIGPTELKSRDLRVSDDGSWSQVLDQRRRRCSESSVRSNSTRGNGAIKGEVSPLGGPITRGKAKGNCKVPDLGPVSARSLSINTNRNRSVSNASKRKRRSLSPAVYMGPIVIDCSPSRDGETETKQSTPIDGGVALDAE